MTVTRIMFDGKTDLEGGTVNSLTVGPMVTRRPQPRYTVTCSCGSVTTESHDRIVSGAARCRSANHNAVTKKRERLEESERIAAQRQAELEAAQLQVSVARMEAETSNYERPERYSPKPSEHLVMTERERLSIREHQEAEEAERRRLDAPRIEAERESAERIAQAEEQFKETASKLAAIERDRIATGTDDQFVIDPATIGDANSVPQSQVKAWHSAQFAEFLKANPDYFQCPENATAISDYLERNSPGLKLLSAAQLTAAFKRLNEFGLLKQRPAQQQPIEQPTRVNLDIAPEPSKPVTGPKMYKGRDYATGLEREFSEREVNRMGSLEFQRAFEVIPTVSELFTQLSEAR